MTRARKAIGSLVAVLFRAVLVMGAAAPAFAAPDFPQLTGRVVDDAGLLDAGQEAALTARLSALEDRTGDQLVIVTLPSLQGETIEEFLIAISRPTGHAENPKAVCVLMIKQPHRNAEFLDRVALHLGQRDDDTVF